MRAQRLVLLLSLALALAACGKRQAEDEHAGTGKSPAAASTRQPASRPGAVAAGQQKAPAATAAQLAHPNEDGSEIVEDTTADSVKHNALLAAVASTVAAATSTAAAAGADATAAWQAGTNYTQLVPAQPTAVPAGQVEVLEFFWYACPHCYAIDPLVESWKKTKAAYISFARVPVTWNDGHRSLAHLYYTLESLGKLEQLHTDVFKEIQVNGDPLVASDPSDSGQTARIQAEFARKSGISEDAFKKAYVSFSVETALQRADQLVQRYRIDGVPTFVVNGKYIADVRSAGSAERLISLVDYLAAQEHKHQ